MKKRLIKSIYLLYMTIWICVFFAGAFEGSYKMLGLWLVLMLPEFFYWFVTGKQMIDGAMNQGERL